MTINIHAAKTSLSRLVKRAEQGECIIIARDGRPVAQLAAIPKAASWRPAPDDPLLNLDTFAVDGPGGDMSNSEIDRVLYGRG